ncbi:MAG: homocysteine S-methyltransferase family protein [Phycisphaerales bacterium]
MPTVAAFIDILKTKTLLCDGAMGTQLMAAGLQPGSCTLTWNVDRSDAVCAIHQRYRDAGCDIITTNSFQGATTALAMHGLSERCAELNRAAAACAAKVAGRGAFVAADVGPFGGFLEPIGDVTPDQLLAIFTEQLRALRDGGANVALVETMSDPSEAAVGVKAARAVADWPVIATFTYQKAHDGFATMMGQSPADVVRAMIDAGADVVGTNCGTALDLSDYVRLAEQLLQAAGDTPVIVQPNAGSPVERDGALHYVATPGDMAELASKLKTMGVKIIGGCCGTSPSHLASMSRAV